MDEFEFRKKKEKKIGLLDINRKKIVFRGEAHMHLVHKARGKYIS